MSALSVDKARQIFVFHSPNNATPQFLKKFNPLFIGSLIYLLIWLTRNKINGLLITAAEQLTQQ